MQKVICIKKLYAEIHKWEHQFGISGAHNMRLLKLYIGMGIDFLINEEGKIMCQDFNKLGKIFHYHNPKRIIELVVKSGSFTFQKCDSGDMNIYGIMVSIQSLWQYTRAPVFTGVSGLKGFSV